VTPFGIRKRLKRLLGLGSSAAPAPSRPQVPRFSVRFELPDGTSYEARGKAGDPIARISGRGPRPLSTGCADTSCGTCAVEILAGADQITAESDHEVRTRNANQVPDGRRLACATAITGEGVVVKVFSVLGEDLG
jgi:ferredoxin